MGQVNHTVYFDEMVGISDVLISKEVRQVWWACSYIPFFRQLLWLVASRHLEKLMILSVSKYDWPWA